MNDTLDDLIARMCEGDAEATEQVFLKLEPGLIRVVRRRLTATLRSRLDASDIVMATWEDFLRKSRGAGWRFSDARHFRRFLFALMRNRLIDYIRRHRTELEREEPLDEAQRDHMLSSRDPSPGEVAQAGELWERIVGLCPPEYLSILSLRREGWAPAEIAAITGLHTGSIRRILRTLARQLGSDTVAPRPRRNLKNSAPACDRKSR